MIYAPHGVNTNNRPGAPGYSNWEQFTVNHEYINVDDDVERALIERAKAAGMKIADHQ